MRFVVRAVCLALLALPTVPGSAAAQEHLALSPEEIVFRPIDPADPNGARIAMLAEDPTGARPHAFRLRLPAGSMVPRHSHAAPEFGTVLSGRIRMAFGENADEASAKVLTAGSFVYLPAGQHHRLWVDEDSVVDVFTVAPVAGDGPRKH